MKAAEETGKTPADLITIDRGTGVKVLPHWLAQPYFRPLPSTTKLRKLDETSYMN
jgi:tRNA-dihydrouridine synthase 1